MEQLMTAFIFPGQGSQSVGMLSELADHRIGRDTLSEAGDAISTDLWRLISEGPEEQLNRTHNTQPAILAVSIALWRLYQQREAHLPDYVAGHSLGEYSALVASNSLTLRDAVRLVRLRGELMQEASPDDVSMAAILGLNDKDVKACCRAACKETMHLVEPANFNAPGQVVVAGHAVAVTEAVALSKRQKARAILLSVSVPAHTKLMRSAADNFSHALQETEISPPEIPIVQNVDANLVRTVEDIRQRLYTQMYKPVQWSKSITALRHLGVQRFIECGPGKVLSGLLRRMDRDIGVETLSSLLNNWEPVP